MPLQTGSRLGPYEILAPIGAGGMGEVYRARDTRLRRDVALKVLPSAFSSDPGRVRRFEQEGRTAAALNHPNIVVLYDAGLQDGVYYVATELLEGETLRQRLAGAVLPVRKAIDYGVQIARGLAAAHAKGIIHRDLKPENLFVTKDGVVKILDFGLAKHQTAKAASAPPTDLETQPMETDPGHVMGTVGYMSPEQVRGQMAEARSDLFSLGLVLYEMVSGKRAFTGDSAVEVMNAILKQEPPELEGALPPALDRIIRRCLEKKPEERFQSAADLAFALESISGSSERKAQAGAPRRRYLRLIALASGAAVLVAAGVFVGQRTTRAPMPSFQRITYRRGYVDNGRFANGGRTIVYSASWDGNPFRVYSSQKESPESRDLGIVNGRVLAVSASDEMALGLTQLWGVSVSGTLARSPVSGGTPRELTDDIAAADWTSDGKQLAVVRVKPGFEQLELPMGHVLYQTTGAIVNPRISPEANLIAFLDEPVGGGGIGSVATVDIKGKKKTLTQYWGGFLSGLVWSFRGDEILFTAADFGLTDSLYAVSRSGHQRLIAHLPGAFAVQDATPDGRLLLAHLVLSNTLSFLPGPNAKETDLYWHDYSGLSDISRDGKVLLFFEGGDATRAGEDFVTYLRRTDGSPAVRLGPGFPLEISPDGKWALVLGSVRAPSQFVLLPTGTGETRQLTHDAIHHQGAAWTPDGKRIVFVGNEPGHRIRFYVQSLDGSPPRAITPENVSYSIYDPVAISPDGRFVAVAGLNGSITLYPLDGGVARAVPKGAEGLSPLRWCQDNSLMVYQGGNVPVKVLRLDVVTGAKAPWKELAPNAKTGLVAITLVRVGADCQSSAYSAWYEPSELWIADGLR
jgi:serine/threonine protein kinase/dipeptidyl aminopeptidase/acylaminoacyl peptidase